jgi:3,4-dihydroxy 2-butanone 4-phosphate synthase/GTP cyclohydrolase II
MLARLEQLKGLQDLGELKAPRKNLDHKDYGIGAQILHDLAISKIKLLTNSEQSKRIGMIGYGLEITQVVGY